MPDFFVVYWERNLLELFPVFHVCAYGICSFVCALGTAVPPSEAGVTGAPCLPSISVGSGYPNSVSPSYLTDLL